jgi:hypothetical protein
MGSIHLFSIWDRCVTVRASASFIVKIGCFGPILNGLGIRVATPNKPHTYELMKVTIMIK